MTELYAIATCLQDMIVNCVALAFILSIDELTTLSYVMFITLFGGSLFP